MLKRFQNRYTFIALSFCFSLILNACIRDIIEPNLSKETIKLLAPADNYSTSTITQLFWWDTVQGANKYNLQIVSPSFSAIQKIVLDTNIKKNNFSFTLIPGNYQWRVRAFNSSSSTAYSVFSLHVDSVVDLSAQSVVLLSPINGLVTNKVQHVFKWDKLYNANEYRFQVENASNAVVIDVTLTKDSATYFLNEGVYKWQVRAQNATSNSLYTTRTITVDTTAPVVSVQSFPAHKDTIAGTDSLAWIRSSSAIGDSLYIYSDSLALSLAYSGFFSTTTYYRYSGIANHNYFWTLRSKDMAGNWSKYGVLQKFSVK